MAEHQPNADPVETAVSPTVNGTAGIENAMCEGHRTVGTGETLDNDAELVSAQSSRRISAR
jgi:hypothetical protein